MVALQMQLSKPSMPCVHLENPFSPPSIRYTAAGTGTHALVSTRATGAVEKDRTMTFCVAFAATVFLVAGGCSRNPSPKPPTPPMGTFTLQCDPFGGLAEHQPIDDRCGPDGIGGANSLAQNRVKHSLCAAEPATAVDFATFQTLQADIPALGIAFGSPQMIPTPADRPKLRHPDTTHGIAVGEGSLVQFVGFVIEAHYSNVQGGENVNCDIPGEPMNDMHIAIGPQLDAPECASITRRNHPALPAARLDDARYAERPKRRHAPTERAPRSAVAVHGTTDVRCQPSALLERPACKRGTGSDVLMGSASRLSHRRMQRRH